MNQNSSSAIARVKSAHIIGALIFAVTLSIFLISRVHQITDSSYSMMLSQSLLDHGSFKLDQYALPPREPVAADDGYVKYGEIYQIEIVNNHLYYHFPAGSAVLSVPFVAVMNRFDVSAVNPDGTYNRDGEARLEASLAALLMAALACIFFYTARLVLPDGWSAVIAFGGAFGTQVYSTASRALWSETWGIFLLGIVLMMLVAGETGKRRVNPFVLASLLSWMYFVRPTNSVHIIVISCYVLLFHRRLFLRYALTGAAWFTGFVIYSWHNFGQVLPNYYRASRLSFEVFGTALAGNLVSPSRGLFIYVPVLLFVFYLLLRYWDEVVHQGLVWLALTAIVCHLFIVSAFKHWWGGHCFGARFTTGLVPWLALLAILGVQAMLRWRERHAGASRVTAWRAQLAIGCVLLVLSMFINTRGAASHATWLWNVRPFNVDTHPEVLWQWRYPQFLAGWVLPPPPRTFPLADGQHVEFGVADADSFIWYGWSGGEGQARWTDGKTATVVFSLEQVEEMTLKMKFGAFIVPDQHGEQRVEMELNGQHIQSFSLADGAGKEYEIKVSREILRPKNILTFKLPDAAAPRDFQINPDARALGINMYWMEFQKASAAR